MIVFPLTQQGQPAVYEDGKYFVNFKLEKTEDGTIAIHRRKGADFDNRSTDILISPTDKGLTISHREKRMVRESSYKFETPDQHAIGTLANAVLEQGELDKVTAKQLSDRIDMEIAACKEKRIGHIVEQASGWKESVLKKDHPEKGFAK